MPTFSSTTALLVIDMQEAVLSGAIAVPEVIDKINELVQRCREAGAPVVWIQNENVNDPEMTAGAPGWQIAAALNRSDEDIVVDKHYRDSFAGTDLDVVLEKGGIKRLLVTGAATSYCVHTTALSAMVRGYDVTLVSDAHTGRGHLLPNGELLPQEMLVDFVNCQIGSMEYPERKIEAVATAGVVL